jgi:cbb3-type cytochrome oxidase subunit 3
MHYWHDIYMMVNEVALVLMMVVFIGIVAWSYSPSRRDSLQAHADIPLRDDDIPPRENK